MEFSILQLRHQIRYVDHVRTVLTVVEMIYLHVRQQQRVLEEIIYLHLQQQLQIQYVQLVQYVMMGIMRLMNVNQI